MAMANRWLLTAIVGFIVVELAICVSVKNVDRRLRVLESKVHLENSEFRSYFDTLFDNLNRSAPNCGKSMPEKSIETGSIVNDIRRDLDTDLTSIKNGFKAEKSLIRHTLVASGKHVDVVKEEIQGALKTMQNELNMTSARNRDICTENVKQLSEVVRLQKIEINSLNSKIDDFAQENGRLKTVVEGSKDRFRSEMETLKLFVTDKFDTERESLLKLESSVKLLNSLASISIHNEVSYVPGNGVKTWDQAKSECEKLTGRLPEVNSYAEQDVLVDIARKYLPKNQLGFWLGGSDAGHEGNWTWANSDRPFEHHFTYWIKGQPDNYAGQEQCLHAYKEYKYRWNDIQCGRKMSYICEVR